MIQRPLFPPDPWEAAKARPAAPVAGPLFDDKRPGPPCSGGAAVTPLPFGRQCFLAALVNCESQTIAGPVYGFLTEGAREDWLALPVACPHGPFQRRAVWSHEIGDATVRADDDAWVDLG